MKNLSRILLAAGMGLAAAAHAHVVLDEPAALAGTSYKATFRVGHSCDGSSTTAIKVFIPAGFRSAHPMPKPGWVLTTQKGKLAKPYTQYGKEIGEDVTEVTWTAASRENWLPDAFYDEFVVRGGLPQQAGPMWFRVLQVCEKSSSDWAQVPASGTSTEGLKSPAALLEIIESTGVAGHQH